MSSPSRTPVVPSFKNILFATDFSQCSLQALPYLRALGERYGSTVHIVHAIAPEPMLEVPLDIPVELDADRDVALTTLKEMMASTPLGKVSFTLTAKRGLPWRIIEELSGEKQVDLIVLGTHGRRGLKKLVLGSVSERVFRLSKCPVLTVGPHALDRGYPDARLATILFATDFSVGSRYTMPYAESLARASDSRLILLHVVSGSTEIVSPSFYVEPTVIDVSVKLVEEDMESARQQLQCMMSDASLEELKPEIVVECGNAAEQIVRVAKQKGADLIIMGAHSASANSLITHFPWATASTVVCEAHCPVLTVRH